MPPHPTTHLKHQPPTPKLPSQFLPQSDQSHPKHLLLLDPGLGTTLEDTHHHKFTSTSTPTWSSHLLISSPRTLYRAHQSFIESGAQIILTATYQASLEGFTRTARQQPQAPPPRTTTSNDDETTSPFYTRREAEKFMRSAIPLARSASSSRHGEKIGIVGLSLGPYGATMLPSTEYSGAYPEEFRSVEVLERWHAERVLVFAGDEETWDGVDVVAFETVPRIGEVWAIRGVMGGLKEGYQGREKPFWVCCVFPGEDERLPDGSEVHDVVRAMLGPTSPSSGHGEGVTRDHLPVPMGIGINCTKIHKLRRLIVKFEDAVTSLLREAQLPYLVIYPDGANDSTYDTQAQRWVTTRETESTSSARGWDEEMYEIVQEVQGRDRWAGILVGGCCKTTPRDIARLREQIDQGEAENLDGSGYGRKTMDFIQPQGRSDPK